MIKEQPERFYRLLDKIPDTVDDAYVTAYINGLAESYAPADWFFAVIRRFGRQPNRRIGTAIYWALEKRSASPLPDDIRVLLEEGIRSTPDEYEQGKQRAGKELYNAYLNSERGTAFRALIRFLKHRGDDPQAIADRWRLIEFASTDPSSVLRAGAIEEILYLMHLDRVRAVTLFEQLLSGHESLVCSYFADDFIYYALGKEFARIRPYIQLMMNAEADECRQRGAELACIAAISPRVLGTEMNVADARDLAEKTLTGDTAWRRGAARIYAFNIVDGPREQCTAALKRLLNDEDAQVRRHISALFHKLRAEHLTGLQSFIEEFAASRAFQDEPHFFAEYLWENSTLFPELTLSLVDIALRNTYTSEANTRYISGEEFVRSVLRIYTDPTTDDALRVTVRGDPASANRSPNRNLLIQLRRFFDTRFSEDELCTVCFDLGIDYDNLAGVGKAGKARELVAHYERNELISELLATARQLRPGVSWADVADQQIPPQKLPLRQRAMDIFDRLMEQFPGQSQQVLEEWDRR